MPLIISSLGSHMHSDNLCREYESDNLVYIRADGCSLVNDVNVDGFIKSNSGKFSDVNYGKRDFRSSFDLLCFDLNLNKCFF